MERKRRPNVVLKIGTLKNILKHRIRGHTLEAIAGIFNLGSRQEVYQVLKKNKNSPELATLYEEVENTKRYLSRKI